jgi:hypothetical protein
MTDATTKFLPRACRARVRTRAGEGIPQASRAFTIGAPTRATTAPIPATVRRDLRDSRQREDATHERPLSKSFPISA